MYKYFIIVFLCFIQPPVCTKGQQIISAFGGTSTAGDLSCTFSSGEVVSQTMTGKDYYFLPWMTHANPSLSSEVIVWNNIKVHPNPADDILCISFSHLDPGSYRCELYTSSGILIHDQELLSTENIISLRHCTKGLYLLIIRQKEEIIHKTKIIKK